MTLSRLSKTPKQYIQGWTEFYKLKFKVSPDVLIPRPETELLVDEVLKFYTLNPNPYTLIDIGTGSGNIAISLACNLKGPPAGPVCRQARRAGCNVKIIATDVSKKALNIARQNAKLHSVSDRIIFIQSNLLQNIPRSYINLSTPIILITNLPYIPSARILYLDSSVKDFEPLVALDGGMDGFNLYRKLFTQISRQPRFLHPKLIVGEIDDTHGKLAVTEAYKYFPDSIAEVKTDLAHKQRILIIKSA